MVGIKAIILEVKAIMVGRCSARQIFGTLFILSPWFRCHILGILGNPDRLVRSGS